MIDLIVLICVVWALILGIKRGLIAQLCHLVGLYMALLIAPQFATQVGSIFMDDTGKAYLAGFILIVAAGLILVWILAPIVKALIVWKPIRPVDTILGGVLNVVTVLVVIASLFSIFDRINISPNIKQEALIELVENHNEGDIKAKVLELCNTDIDDQMRQYFEHKYVDYETLESSFCFYPLARVGTTIIPSIKNFDETIRTEAHRAINEKIFFNF